MKNYRERLLQLSGLPRAKTQIQVIVQDNYKNDLRTVLSAIEQSNGELKGDNFFLAVHTVFYFICSNQLEEVLPIWDQLNSQSAETLFIHLQLLFVSTEHALQTADISTEISPSKKLMAN